MVSVHSSVHVGTSFTKCGELPPCLWTSRLGLHFLQLAPSEMNSITICIGSKLLHVVFTVGNESSVWFAPGQRLSTIILSKINKFRLHLISQSTLDVVFFKRKTDQGQSFGKENPILKLKIEKKKF